MVAGTLPSTGLRCTKAGCNSTFSNKSNLNRHLKSKHGPKVLTACGKDFPNQPWNIKRHMKTCGECKRKKDDNTTGPEKQQHDDSSTPPDTQQNDAHSLNLYGYLFEDGAAGPYDFILGDIGNIDTISCGYEEYPLDLENQ